MEHKYINMEIPGKINSLCLESISELSLSVPLLAFSKFKMAASSHIEIQQKKKHKESKE